VHDVRAALRSAPGKAVRGDFGVKYVLRFFQVAPLQPGKISRSMKTKAGTLPVREMGKKQDRQVARFSG
jgi:hypothetical protein